MDAGFHIEWFQAIENHGWNWICRIRQGKDLKLTTEAEWISVKDYIPLIQNITKEQGNVLLTKAHQYSCRMVTTRKDPKGDVNKKSVEVVQAAK